MNNEEILIAAIKKADVNLDEEPLVIFTHKFAKKFWGNKDSYRNVIASGRKLNNTQATQTAWKFHLQQMGLEENPIKYLEKFL